MPIYRYKCSECGLEQDGFNKIDDRASKAPECHGQMELKIMPTMLNMDMAPWDSYESPVSGKPITSYKDRKADMEEHGCVDYEPSMTKHTTQHMKDCDAALEKNMDETVEKEIEKMPVRKREKLENELNSGADIAYERH